jgi:uncharacterized protein (TIGR03435 family)
MGDRPVLDQTGLTGNCDFRVVSDPADISPNAAVEEFGLKLVAQKARIDIMAVEKPDEN